MEIQKSWVLYPCWQQGKEQVYLVPFGKHLHLSTSQRKSLLQKIG